MPKGLFFRSVIAGISLVLAETAASQPPDDETAIFYTEREYERHSRLRSDTTLFYRAIQHPTDLYGDYNAYTLPDVSIRRRGLRRTSSRATWSGIGLSSRYWMLLRQLGAESESVSGLGVMPGVHSGAGIITRFSFPEGESPPAYRVSARFTDRNYRFGARVSGNRNFGPGWTLSAAADFRTGRDMHVEGVFTNAVTAGFHLGRTWNGQSRFSLLCVLPVSLRGTRLSSSEEAFTLTGNRLYNPAWGYQDGRVRNSRVRREMLPLTLLSWSSDLGRSTKFSLAAGLEAGTSRYSMLGWYDAATPMPDNYRYLPSYTGDRSTEEAWLGNDTRYTQIDWDELIRQNRMAGGAVIYALEDRVERSCDWSSHLLFETVADQRLTLYYGLELESSNHRSYKEMRDLLGGSYLIDIDQYLVDDDTYGTQLQNDLRHPDRVIREGDRFGYDYSLIRQGVMAFFQGDYRSDRLRAAVSVSLGSSRVYRRGHYEKELYPGSQSFGRSRVIGFSPYALKTSGGWSFTPRHHVELSLFAEARMPSGEDLFYQPLYNNRTIDNPTAERTYGAEVNYRLTGPVLNLQATFFLVLELDGTQTRRYYDDLSYVYCDMAVTGIGTRSCGLEAAASLRLSSRWRMTLSGTASSYRYVRNPRVWILSDVDNTVIDQGSESRLGDCRVGGTPQMTGSCEVSWFGRQGWGVHASAGYAGLRYVEVEYLRRTDRLAGQAGITRESFEAFTHQERLPDAMTLDATLFKSIRIDRSRLVFSLVMRNLLGSADTIYNGYESLRVLRIRSGDTTYYTPQATRYLYALPRTFYLTVSYRF